MLLRVVVLGIGRECGSAGVETACCGWVRGEDVEGVRHGEVRVAIGRDVRVWLLVPLGVVLVTFGLQA